MRGWNVSQVTEHGREICALLVTNVDITTAAASAVTAALGRKNALVVVVVLPRERLYKVRRCLDADRVVKTRDARCVHP